MAKEPTRPPIGASKGIPPPPPPPAPPLGRLTFTMIMEPHTPTNPKNPCEECVLQSGPMCMDRSYCEFRQTGKTWKKHIKKEEE